MDVEVLGIMIPIIGIVLGVTIAIVSIVTSHRQKVQRADQRHKERLAAIEKGLDLPFEAAEPENGKKGGSLRSGLIGLFVGVVLYFAINEVAGSDVALFGLIPAAVGIANLLAYFLEGRKAIGKKE
jgi:predicted membrane-bound spermidine synthase